MLPSPAWKTLAIRMLCRSPTWGDEAEDVGEFGPRDNAVLGAERGAESPDGAEGGFSALPDRHVLRFLAGPPRDRLLDGAAVGLHDLGNRLASRSRPASRPSTSMISTAPASVGKPKWKACSIA